VVERVGEEIQNNDVGQSQADKEELHGVLWGGLCRHKLCAAVVRMRELHGAKYGRIIMGKSNQCLSLGA
jgi:hypothetical protein